MTPSRLLRWTAIAVVVGIAFLSGAKHADPEACPACPAAAEEEVTNAVYSLKDLGGDAEFGRWVVETIREVIEPKSWASERYCEREGECSNASRVGFVRYNAQNRILVVHQTAAVQVKVDAFLKDLAKGHMAGTRAPRPADLGVIRADFQERVGNNPMSDPGAGYPVPPPNRQPKHLFHLIIRYEGEGIIDDHVADVIKARIGKMGQEEKADSGPAALGAGLGALYGPPPFSAPPATPTGSPPRDPLASPLPPTPPIRPGTDKSTTPSEDRPKKEGDDKDADRPVSPPTGYVLPSATDPRFTPGRQPAKPDDSKKDKESEGSGSDK